MYFRHSPDVWHGHPSLVPGVLIVEGISPSPNVEARVAEFQAAARARLDAASEGDWPEIQAWRRAFSQMGLKPTQYRCASESLLRRFRKDGALPQLHPLVDLCNAVSLAFGIPIAVFDIARIEHHLEVGFAVGDERYESFAGEIERPEPGEVVFTDAARCAHARRWSHRQSACSAVQSDTSAVLIVAEAHHRTAPADMTTLLDALDQALTATWAAPSARTILSEAAPVIEF